MKPEDLLTDLVKALDRIGEALEGIEGSLEELSRGPELQVSGRDGVEVIEGPPRVVVAIEEIARNLGGD